MTQGTRKQGYKAYINIREYILHLHYLIDSSVASTLLKWRLKLKEEEDSLLKSDVEQVIAINTHKHYVSLSTAEAHHHIYDTFFHSDSMPSWTWDKLPKEYMESAYICTDATSMSVYSVK